MKREVIVLLFVSCASCSRQGAAPGGGQTCPRNGTVLADMRDVERDAEGVSYAVFGPAPDHVSVFTRAPGVLSFLRPAGIKQPPLVRTPPADSVATVKGLVQ